MLVFDTRKLDHQGLANKGDARSVRDILPLAVGRVFCVRLSPDGQRVYAASTNRINVFDLE